MTRNRINLDIPPHLDNWLTTTAKTMGYTKTETVRAILEHHNRHHLTDPFMLAQYVTQHRLEANQARSQSQTAHHQARRGSTPEHQPE